MPVLTTDVQDPGGDKALAAVVMPSSLCELPDPQPMQILVSIVMLFCYDMFTMSSLLQCSQIVILAICLIPC